MSKLHTAFLVTGILLLALAVTIFVAADHYSPEAAGIGSGLLLIVTVLYFSKPKEK